MKRSFISFVLVAAALATGPVFFASAGGQQPPPAQPAGQQQQPPPAQPAQPAQEQEQRPVIRRGVSYVSVDVIVTDSKGNPILDLKPEDFEVFEEGKPQKVESFQVVKVDQPLDAPPPSPVRTQADIEREASRADVRIFAFLLDDYHVRRGASLGVRDPLARFVQEHIMPSDLVGVMYPLTPVSDFQLTRNHDALARAFKGFLGRKFEYEPRNEFEERYAYYPAETVERIRNQVTLSALRGLVTHLGGLREGRKAVILVSEGFSNTLPAQLADPVAAMPGVGNPNRGRLPGIGEPPGPSTREFFAQTDLMTDMREVYAAANRANTSIYTLDPRGLAPFEFDINEGVDSNADRLAAQTTRDTLYTLANETDGRAIVNRNDLDAGLRQIVRDSSAYYLLGYNSTQSPTDGKFHEIKVRIKRPGVQVRARKGYWAYTADDAARITASASAAASGTAGNAPEVDRALSTLAAPRSRPVRTWVGTARAEDGRTRVTFTWEPAPAGPGAVSSAPPEKISLTAVAPGGEPYFRGAVEQRTMAHFDVPPGPLQLRYNIESADGRLIDSDTRELTAPDYTKPAVQLSTPVLLRGRTARDLQALRTNPQAAPSASREFSRAERIVIRVRAYAPGGQTPAVTARLLNRTGKSMADLPMKAPAEAGGDHESELPLSALAAGEYLIEVKAAAPGAGEAKELIALKVTS
ncbi:MAG TPA: VWA domain-containing protein [Vicinamibacterales bacterium]|nr:VWA domain-containing protein [Vicinamibacterales bacterium]